MELTPAAYYRAQGESEGSVVWLLANPEHAPAVPVEPRPINPPSCDED